ILADRDVGERAQSQHENQQADDDRQHRFFDEDIGEVHRVPGCSMFLGRRVRTVGRLYAVVDPDRHTALELDLAAADDLHTLVESLEDRDLIATSGPGVSTRSGLGTRASTCTLRVSLSTFGLIALTVPANVLPGNASSMRVTFWPVRSSARSFCGRWKST